MLAYNYSKYFPPDTKQHGWAGNPHPQDDTPDNNIPKLQIHNWDKPEHPLHAFMYAHVCMYARKCNLAVVQHNHCDFQTLHADSDQEIREG